MGKGSVRRPPQINDQQMQDNWDRIFGNKGEKPCQTNTKKEKH